MSNNLRDMSYSFSVKIVQLYKEIINNSKEYVLSKQLLRSGTAIGALIREGRFAQSKNDFISKLSIALKEANESLYWLDLLKDTQYITLNVHKELSHICNELVSMLVASINTLKNHNS